MSIRASNHRPTRAIGSVHDKAFCLRRLVPIAAGLRPSGAVVTNLSSENALVKAADAPFLKFAERQQLFLAVVESSDDAIITKTLDGIITGWNRAAESLFGFTARDAVGKSIDIIVSAEMRNEVRVILDRIRDGQKVDHHETVRIAKDGRPIDVSLSISPLKSPSGEIIGAAKICRDITAQKIDKRTLARHIEELQRSNADLEQFAYVASHDLQEPLRMVATYTALLSEHYKDSRDEKTEKYVRYALDGARRMQQLVKDLLAYARVDSQGKLPKEIQSATVVKNALSSLGIAIKESRAEIVCDELPVVSADAVQLTQVFQNLIGNALKFHGDRPPRIRVGAKRNRDNWTFCVEDNGIGIGKEYAGVVFQMFQRLHERGRYEGSGIGLAIAKKIVERHGGRIWFDSKLDKGTIFYFTIPTAQGQVT